MKRVPFTPEELLDAVNRHVEIGDGEFLTFRLYQEDRPQEGICPPVKKGWLVRVWGHGRSAAIQGATVAAACGFANRCLEAVAQREEQAMDVRPPCHVPDCDSPHCKRCDRHIYPWCPTYGNGLCEVCDLESEMADGTPLHQIEHKHDCAEVRNVNPSGRAPTRWHF